MKKYIFLTVFLLLGGFVLLLLVPEIADAAIAYDPMLVATDFDGPTADAKTAATGVLTIFFMIFVVGIIMSVIR